MSNTDHAHLIFRGSLNEGVEWYLDHAELLAFARALAEAGILGTVADVLYFFEKPWKWTPEHGR